MKRFILRALGSLVLLAVVLAAYVYARSEASLRKTWTLRAETLAVPTDADAIARGAHLAVTRGCTDCHGADLGGRVMMEEPPIGRLGAPNLTRGPGGVTAGFSPVDWERAIRHGVTPQGRALLFMPIRDYAGLADADLADLIAYVVQVPPVERTVAASYVGPVGRALYAFGQLPLLEADLVDHAAAHPAAMAPAANADYGRYVAQSCTGCHGQTYSGGAIPGVPPSFPKARNITPDADTGIGRWSRDDFVRAVRQGKRPDGSTLDPFMPYQAFASLSDIEVDALWAYLHGVPARAYGNH